MFWIWFALEISFLGFASIFALRGSLTASVFIALVAIVCQNNRIAESAKARELLRYYGVHR